ncbi:hypothetical protein MANES_08G136850v8 [Manihot esculenta]|uniref:Uncharacterized protein n=3 Tax=Manihot esculenta TaxID=3983 RepID=A0ACB7HAY9_MANES|nr:hypothetical protein MANES_08G136850v8 [Manihot esculenta]KAG8649761.1 hypothetical protein MANES_08G136850v8 [Manihot esculenta]KAG8649762.1 hypothetical protein MANES_08G136850v8 [Manihot esculenta]
MALMPCECEIGSKPVYFFSPFSSSFLLLHEPFSTSWRPISILSRQEEASPNWIVGYPLPFGVLVDRSL